MSSEKWKLTPEELDRLVSFFEILIRVDRRIKSAEAMKSTEDLSDKVCSKSNG